MHSGQFAPERRFHGTFGQFDARLDQSVPSQSDPISARGRAITPMRRWMGGPSPPCRGRPALHGQPIVCLCYVPIVFLCLCYVQPSLAGVRGFGANQLEAAAARGDSQFQCPGGRSGIRSNKPGHMAAAKAIVEFQCPGGRSGIRRFGGVLPWPVVWFQCPGGRSGIRRGSTAITPRLDVRRFNALAGVRGFGGLDWRTDWKEVLFVSMPWRAFGDSEPEEVRGRWNT